MDRRSQLDEEDEEDEEERTRRRRRRRRRRRTRTTRQEKSTDIKSNNPHLAGGEKRFCPKLESEVLQAQI